MYTDIQKIWQYLAVTDALQRSDIIFVLGRDDFNITRRAAELFVHGLAPRILAAGGRGRMTGAIHGSEAAAFKEALEKEGIPSDKILTEERSTNTRENISEGLGVLQGHGLTVKRAIIVTHAPHMRRALAVAKAYDNGIEWLAAPDVCIPTDNDGNEVRGEVKRLVEYPALGYFAPQDIPTDILTASRSLDN